MIRMSSFSDVKKSGKKNQDNRTTKTKASATKPEMFTMSLTRNKNNPNPSLFNSTKKEKNEQKFLKIKSEKKKSHCSQNQINLFESLHTKISFDYINSLFSDIAIGFGVKLKDQLQNKQNVLSQKNLNVPVKVPLKEQKQCLNKIGNLVKLKQKINSSYQLMKNTQCILNYTLKEKKNQDDSQNSLKQIKTFPQIHQNVSNFISYFQSIEKQLKNLELQYQSHIQKTKQNQEKQQQQDHQDQSQLDSIIQYLKDQIAQQKNLSLRYERQEKFLISKLYFTQKKNTDLKASSSNLQIKNTNLKDTIRFSIPKSQKKAYQSAKNMKRSFSVKLQRIKKYNFDDDPINISNLKTQRQILRSKSTSSLNSARHSSAFPLNHKKQTFLDKIY